MFDKSKLEVGLLVQNQSVGVYGWIRSFSDKEMIIADLSWIQEPSIQLFKNSSLVTYTPSTSTQIFGDKFKLLDEDNWEIVEFNISFKPNYLL